MKNLLKEKKYLFKYRTNIKEINFNATDRENVMFESKKKHDSFTVYLI